MKNIGLRFFILCVLLTVLISGITYYFNNIIAEKNDRDSIKIMTQGLFTSLDYYLWSYPEREWQQILDKNKPQGAGQIKILPLSNAPLTPSQIDQLKANQIVCNDNEVNPYEQTAVYKRIGHSDYIYRSFIYFNSLEWMKRTYSWPIKLITDKLKTLPGSEWPDYLAQTSHLYGFPILVTPLNTLSISQKHKSQLTQGNWVIDFPDKSNDEIQTLYVQSPKKGWVLQFGPIPLPFTHVYKRYILFTFLLILIELITFIIVILFTRSLGKIISLAKEYGKGNFTYQTTLSKNSTLFPLFNTLKTMGEQIKNLITSHKELTNAVSHELRTPISRLHFSLELLKESKDINQIASRTKAMQEDLLELEELVTEMLTYSQLDSSTLHIEPEKLEITYLFDLAVNQFKKNPSTKRFEYHIDETLRNQFIFTHEKYFLRMLQNLLQNAEKFSTTTFKLSIAQTAPLHYEMIIEDDGLGISDEDKKRVFEPFVQLSNQPEHRKKGYGLGLPIVKKIVDHYHWNITLSDSALGGLKITISLYNSHT